MHQKLTKEENDRLILFHTLIDSFLYALTNLHIAKFRIPHIGTSLLLRKTYTVLFFGSTHTHVPVEPVCPYAAAGVDTEHELFFKSLVLGLSKPNP